jgi:hydrogenase-4 membrane subunit HyfE
MFVVIFLVLGIGFGYAARLPWCLLAFVIPLALFLVATDRTASSAVIGFVVTAIGILLGLVLATRTDEQQA